MSTGTDVSLLKGKMYVQNLSSSQQWQQVYIRIESLPPANEVWGKVIFLHVCVILWLRGVRGCGGGGMRGCQGACMVVGGHMWLPGMCLRYDEIRSMSGRYAFYWNAFLLSNNFLEIFSLINLLFIKSSINQHARYMINNCSHDIRNVSLLKINSNKNAFQ